MTRSWNKKLTAVLIVLVLVVGSLSGCLGGEKQELDVGSEEVSKKVDLAFESFLQAGEFVDEAYRAEGDKDYERAELLFRAAKKSYEQSHNHFISLLNKTGDPRTDEIVFYFSKSTGFYANASEAEERKAAYLAIGDRKSAEITGDEAHEFYMKAQEFDDKTREIFEDLGWRERRNY